MGKAMQYRTCRDSDSGPERRLSPTEPQPSQIAAHYPGPQWGVGGAVPTRLLPTASPRSQHANRDGEHGFLLPSEVAEFCEGGYDIGQARPPGGFKVGPGHPGSLVNGA